MSSKHPPYPITLQISLTPWDLPHASLVLPHQLQFWAPFCSESRVLWDRDPGPRIQSEAGQRQWQHCLELLPVFQAALQRDWPDLVQKSCDLSGPEADPMLEALGQRYFLNPHVDQNVPTAQPTQVPPMPRKDFRGGPFAAYFLGLEQAAHELVLHLDGDMLFGGSAPAWLAAALQILADQPNCLCVAPPGGPPAPVPTAGLRAEFQQKQRIFTSRCFLIRRSDLLQAVPYALRLPAQEGELGWVPPYAELVEEILTRHLQNQGYYRLDYSPAHAGIWSLHPPTQFEPRYLPLLPRLIAQMQKTDWPPAQIGSYDLLPTTLAWLAAQETE